jgi:hypothetical protein
LSTRSLVPSGNNTRNIGVQAGFRYREFATVTAFRSIDTTHSSITIKENIKRISNENLDASELFFNKNNIPLDSNVFSGLIELFNSVNFYKFSYKTEEEESANHIGLIIEEIEAILDGNIELLSYLINTSSVAVVDENGVETGEFEEIKELRLDNVATLRTLILKEIYKEIIELEKKDQILADYINNNSN